MHPLPHVYTVTAATAPAGAVTLASPGLDELGSDAPAEFDGPGDKWSPETLLVASLVDCFVLSFRAVAKASRFDWQRLDCRAEGKLDRVDRATQFTEFTLHATLTLPAGADQERARKLLEKAEQLCLISNSLKASKYLEITLLEITLAAG
ncbi:MAG: OsmC family protein [Gammaproteobacteria bacterium]|jgi:organic hydroperoxide reductase OsmC/OhrA